MSGLLLQSFHINRDGCIKQPIEIPHFKHLEVTDKLKLGRDACQQVAANWVVPTFADFVLRTPDAEAASADLSHARMWEPSKVIFMHGGNNMIQLMVRSMLASILCLFRCFCFSPN